MRLDVKCERVRVDSRGMRFATEYHFDGVQMRVRFQNVAKEISTFAQHFQIVQRDNTATQVIRCVLRPTTSTQVDELLYRFPRRKKFTLERKSRPRHLLQISVDNDVNEVSWSVLSARMNMHG